MHMEGLEQIAAIAGLVLALLVFGAMAFTGALADGAQLPSLRRQRRSR